MMQASKILKEAAELDALVVGLSPAVAAGAVYTSMAQSMGILFENAVSAQKLQTLTGNLVVLESILQRWPKAAQEAEEDIAADDPVAKLTALLEGLKKFN
jgi:alkyl hydroperoxide reductase subunit AhpF